MKKYLSIITFISFILLIHACSSTSEGLINVSQLENNKAMKYPGPVEANEILLLWQKAIQSRDHNAISRLMPEPEIIYENKSGEEITFNSIESVLAFRFEYYNDLGPAEQYVLPEKVDRYESDWGHLYFFDHTENGEVLEIIQVLKTGSTWSIPWVKYVKLTPGSWVTNKLSAWGDLDNDGFLTDSDDWMYAITLGELFRGPHESKSYIDEYFDKDNNSYITSDEIEYAADKIIVKALQFSRNNMHYEVPQKDYTGDRLINDDDIYEIKKLILDPATSKQTKDDLMGEIFWLPLPDFLLTQVPRKVDSYIDFLTDADNDGQISVSEQQILESTFTVVDAQENYLFRALDRNKDNNIGGNELNLAMQISAGKTKSMNFTPPPYPANTPMDELLDLSRDSMVDSQEIQNAITLFSGNSLDQILISVELQNLIDSNLDGELTIREIERFKADHFYPRRTNPDNIFDIRSDADENRYIEIPEIGIVAGFAGGAIVSSFDDRIHLNGTRRPAEQKIQDQSRLNSSNSDAIQDNHIAVLNVDMEYSSLDVKTGGMLAIFIENAMINLGSLQLVDRRNMNSILSEMELQLTGMIDESTAVDLGQLIGADIIAQGALSELSGEYFLSLKLIKVETSEILTSSIASVSDTEKFIKMAEDVVSNLY